MLTSEPVTINADGRLWKVNNYEGEYLGRITLTQAIAYSDNSVFSQLTALVGPRNVRDTARALGITTKLNGYFAIGLGAEPATPLEMARAYASFADGGFRVDGSVFGDQPRAISKIQDSKGDVTANDVVAKPVLTPTQAETVNQLLQGVVQFGTGKAAQLPGRQVAGKTGTTENFGDAWFVGYTPQFVTAVWVGYPDKLVPMTTEFHGKPVAGGTFPALIWKAFMQKALAKLPPESFTPPDYGYAAPVTVVNRGGELERDDGVCHNTAQLQFFGGEVLNNGATPPASPPARRTRSRSRTRSGCHWSTPGRGCRVSRSALRSSTSPRRPVSSSASSSARSRAREPRRPAIRSRSCCASRCTASCRTWSACRSAERGRSSHGSSSTSRLAAPLTRQGRQAVRARPHRVAARREDRAHRARNGRLTNREPARP